jgi:predicted NAD/FAD-binding protein
MAGGPLPHEKQEAMMTGKKVAVIGAGVSGVVAAHYLARKYQVVLFEANSRIGGHTNTIHIPEDHEADPELAVDTGFIVYNDQTYPNFIRFLSELGITGTATDMSFSFSDLNSGLAYAGTDLNGLFACRMNLVSPGFYYFLWQITRFCQKASQSLAKGDLEGLTLRQYLENIKIPPRLLRDYLGPMTQAIWSAPEEDAQNYPAASFIRFFDNHGLLSLPGKVKWRYIKGGSNTYLKAFANNFSGEIRLASPVKAVIRKNQPRPLVQYVGGSEEFDAVVMAAHADQTLAMLPDANQNEKQALAPWRYSKNHTVLHTDTSHMPLNQRAWACWNVQRKPSDQAQTPVRVTYWMNRLQRLSAQKNWLVSLNADQAFAPKTLAYETVYEHPIYNLESLDAQKRLPQISGPRQTYFCGSYHGYGFHEDGARSAVEITSKHFGIEP